MTSLPETFSEPPQIQLRAETASRPFLSRWLTVGTLLATCAVAACGESRELPKDYTVAQFVAERDKGDCPEGKWLKFDDVDVIGPDTAGVYTMTQDGAADAEDPKILFTMGEEAMTGGEVSSVNLVTVHVLAGCVIQISSAQSQ